MTLLGYRVLIVLNIIVEAVCVVLLKPFGGDDVGGGACIGEASIIVGSFQAQILLSLLDDLVDLLV